MKRHKKSFESLQKILDDDFMRIFDNETVIYEFPHVQTTMHIRETNPFGYFILLESPYLKVRYDFDNEDNAVYVKDYTPLMNPDKEEYYYYYRLLNNYFEDIVDYITDNILTYGNDLKKVKVTGYD